MSHYRNDGDMLLIKMQLGVISCDVCGSDTEHRWGIPTYNGDIVSNTFPDDIFANWGGNIAVCEDCFTDHANGKMKTFDHYYVPPTVMGVHLIDGGGI